MSKRLRVVGMPLTAANPRTGVYKRYEIGDLVPVNHVRDPHGQALIEFGALVPVDDKGEDVQSDDPDDSDNPDGGDG